MKTTLHTAKFRVWLTKCGLLVGDGDVEATSLLARAGQQLTREEVDRYENASDFFDGLDKQEAPKPKAEKKK